MLTTSVKFYTSWTSFLETIVTFSPQFFKLFRIYGPMGPDYSGNPSVQHTLIVISFFPSRHYGDN